MTMNQQRLDEVYTYIKDRIEYRQGAPTYREISEACDIALGTVSDCLSLLEAQGKITRNRFKSRSIRLVTNDTSSVGELESDTADDVYDYLMAQIEQGYIPTQEDIATACYISRTEVRRTLILLETQGRIERVGGQRNIRLTD